MSYVVEIECTVYSNLTAKRSFTIEDGYILSRIIEEAKLAQTTNHLNIVGIKIWQN